MSYSLIENPSEGETPSTHAPPPRYGPKYNIRTDNMCEYYGPIRTLSIRLRACDYDTTMWTLAKS